MLPAENGDCLWIEYGDPQRPHRIVIDCGAKSTAGLLASRLNGTPLELFVLTHIDADHINGVVPLFEDPALQLAVGDVWFNGWRQINRFLGVKQGEQFSDLLEQRELPWNRKMTPAGDSPPAPVVVAAGQSLPFYDLDGGMRLTVLSPGKAQLERMARDWKKALVELNPQKVAMLGRKPAPQPVKDFAAFALEPLASAPARPDPSVANGSSIALLAEFDGRSVLLTGDAHADVLIQSIGQLMRERGKDGQKLKLDAVKLSHHGSGNATTIALLQVLDCGRLPRVDQRQHLQSPRPRGDCPRHPARRQGADALLQLQERDECALGRAHPARAIRLRDGVSRRGRCRASRQALMRLRCRRRQ